MKEKNNYRSGPRRKIPWGGGGGGGGGGGRALKYSRKDPRFFIRRKFRKGGPGGIWAGNKLRDQRRVRARDTLK